MKDSLKKMPALVCIITVSVLLSACSSQTLPSDGQFASLDYPAYLNDGHMPGATKRSIFSTMGF